jgi:stress-induced morphogen
MAEYEQLKKKVYQVLKTGYFNGPDDAVDVSAGPEDSLHLVIVSRKFDGQRLKERNDLIWYELTQHLVADEWGKVSLSIGMSPEEIKAT